ncbi:MurR/RpiR family transcriptional regulator [Kribbella sp. NPDC056861]|uniref:MurR/RpiR family transcriptional regulator n=1 Tax=Kribbella sp. NPDC056861 TaxID=3154857 RepID=UPI003429ADFD
MSGPDFSDSILGRLRALLPGLRGALADIAGFVLADPAGVAKLTIVQLAEATGTSPGTVTRFSRACGLERFADLRVALAVEMGRSAARRWSSDIGRGIGAEDSARQVLDTVAAAGAQALVNTADQLDLVAADLLSDHLATARHCHFFGVGTSAVTALEMAVRLRRLEVACWTWTDVHSALIAVTLADERDLVVGVSSSGQVVETLEVIEAAADRGAQTAVITRNPASPIARRAGLVLTTAPPRGDDPSDVLADRHAQFLVLDLIYARIAQRARERTGLVLAATAAAVEGHRLPVAAQQSRSDE